MTERSLSPLRSALVGRDAELDRLHVALDDVFRGSGRVVLISGEPGIGKTRLAEELAAHAADRGSLVAWGRLDDVDGAPPYWPWHQVLKGVRDGIDDDVAREALGEHAAAIAAIAPWVAELVADLPSLPPLAPAAARFRLHEAIVGFLGRVAAHRRLTLVLEDMHWADVASLELTRFLASRLRAAAVLLVFTYRTVDAGGVELLDDVLGSLARLPALERIDLEGLSEPEVGRFMAQTIGLRPQRTAVAAVHARTEGNPFFVAELALLLHSEGRIRMAAGSDHVTVPVGVRDVVRRRLSRLQQDTNDLLAVAAVVGREFDVALLAAGADGRELDVVATIEPAVAAGLVTENPAAVGRLRFSHALIRDTVYSDLSALRRATLHARVGGALEQRGGDDAVQLSELAQHFFHAAAVAGPDRGLAYSLRAAEAAEATLAYERAEQDLRRALSLVELMAARDERIVQELHVQNRIAALLTITRGHADAEVGRACARARELSHEVGDSVELITTLSGLFNFHFVRGDRHIAGRLGEQLLTIGEQQGSVLALAIGHLCRGTVQAYVDGLAVSRASLAKSVSFSRRLELSAQMAEDFRMHPLPTGLGYVARYGWLAGDDNAVAAGDEALAIARRIGHPYTLAFALYMNTQLAVQMADAAAAERWAQEAGEFCDLRGFAMLGCWSRIFHGWALAEQGRTEDGVPQMISALAMHHATGAQMNTSLFLGLLADGERHRGDGEQALALVDEAIAIATASADRIYEADLHRRRGELLAAGDNAAIEQARAALRTAIAIAETQGAVVFRRRAETALAAISRVARRGDAPGRDCNLSPRECELLALVGAGLTDKEIASRLVISIATVRSHLDRIREKTGRRRRHELTRLADELGLCVGATGGDP